MDLNAANEKSNTCKCGCGQFTTVFRGLCRTYRHGHNVRGKHYIMTENGRKNVSKGKLGKKQSENHRKSISRAKLGEKHSEEHNKNVSIAIKNKIKIDPVYYRQILDNGAKGRRNTKHSSTKPEIVIKNYLTELGLEFKQDDHDLVGTPDFVIESKKLIIFSDGDHYHANQDLYNSDFFIKHLRKTAQQVRDKDAEITKKLQLMGYAVLRFWESDINRNLNVVKNKILQSISTTNI